MAVVFFAPRSLAFLLLAVATLRADWLIEQRNPRFAGHTTRWVIGKSAAKVEWREGTSYNSDLIVDFTAGVVARVDHLKKTVATISFDGYLKQQAANSRAHKYVPAELATVAGLRCTRHTFSYSSGANVAGGWGSGEGCFTREISLPAPFDKKFEQFIDALEDRRGGLGVTLAFKAGHGGPQVVTVETVRAVQQPAAASEFKPPSTYKKVEFTRP